MICDVNATLEAKLEAISNRTPDQRMAREGVPVWIGGKVFEVQPLVRKQAREFRSTQLKAATEIESLPEKTFVDSLAILDLSDDMQLQMIAVVIPELADQTDWIDDNATPEELAEAIMVATVFVRQTPNPGRAQTRAVTEDSDSPASTPSSANSTPPTPLQPLTKS